MAENKNANIQYKELVRAIKEKNPGNLYVFTGEERYLLEHCLKELRRLLVAEGFEEFNHRRLEGKNLDIGVLLEAIDALPVFSEHTMVEVWDFEFGKLSETEREEMLNILSDIPEYVCIVFVYDIVEFKLDARVKINAKMKKLLPVVEFKIQDKADLVNWIGRRFKALGKKMSRETAEYLAFSAGGLMTTLVTEIEKAAAYCKGDTVRTEDIDAVVTPVLDAAVYKMTDALVSHRYNDAAAMLSDLIGMNEPPHKILYSVSMKLRQLFAARICIENGAGIRDLMDSSGIKYDFQARAVMQAARSVSMEQCRLAVRTAADTALALNSGGGNECLTDLLIKLSYGGDSV